MVYGSGTPWAKWTETDHSGPIKIITVLCLLYWIVPGIAQQVILYGQFKVFTWADRIYISSMVRFGRWTYADQLI